MPFEISDTDLAIAEFILLLCLACIYTGRRADEEILEELRQETKEV